MTDSSLHYNSRRVQLQGEIRRGAQVAIRRLQQTQEGAKIPGGAQIDATTSCCGN